MLIDLFNDDVKCGKRDVTRNVIGSSKMQANQISCNITFSSLDIIIKKVYCSDVGNFAGFTLVRKAIFTSLNDVTSDYNVLREALFSNTELKSQED